MPPRFSFNTDLTSSVNVSLLIYLSTHLLIVYLLFKITYLLIYLIISLSIYIYYIYLFTHPPIHLSAFILIYPVHNWCTGGSWFTQAFITTEHVTLAFTPYPLFQWYPKSNESLLNLSMKC
jgi:hypothetical protein